MTTSTIEEKTQATAHATPEPKPTAKAKATKRSPLERLSRRSRPRRRPEPRKPPTPRHGRLLSAPKKAKAGKRASKSEKPAQARPGIKTAYSGQARSLRPVCSGVARNSRFGVDSVRFFM